MKRQTEVLGTSTAEEREHSIRRAAEILSSGGVVALPTETVYGLGARADDEAALGRLRAIKDRDPSKPFTIVFATQDAAMSQARDVSAAANRLARRYWPGPLTLILTSDRSRAPGAPPTTQSSHAPDTRGGEASIGVRVPGDRLCQKVLAATGSGIALPSANPAGAPPAQSKDAVLRYFDGQIDAIVDGGPSAMGTPSTVVDARNGEIRVAREGFLTEAEIRRNAALSILFVCSGNTCRSPMAEALLKSALAETLQTTVADLPAAGFRIGSAGLHASPGYPASEGALAAMERRSIDLSAHRSRPLDLDLLREQDQIIVMTRSIYDGLLRAAQDPKVIKTLHPDGTDVIDPFGGPDAVYERCAGELEIRVREIAAALAT